MTPVTRQDYQLGVPKAGIYIPVFNSDDPDYGGTGTAIEAVETYPGEFRDYRFKGNFTLPPMSLTIWQRKPKPRNKNCNSMQNI